MSTGDPPGARSFYRAAPGGPKRRARGRGSPDVAFPPLLPGTFLERPNRFLVIARVGGRRLRAACRDPGRLRELLVPGAPLLLSRSRDPSRRTAYTLVLVRAGRTWVSLVPALANRILEAALVRGGVPGLEGARVIGREVARGRSRFDFLLWQRGSRLLTEVKSCTLVEAGCALFPDAPTERGARHVRELIEVRRRRGGALVVFIVQRPDARSLSPYAEKDPAFTRALAESVGAGVGVLAYTCLVSPAGVALDRRIPVAL